MTNWLLNIVLKGEQDYSDRGNRLKVGYLAGGVGVIANIILAIIKLTIGLLISSIGVIADGVNNFADSASSIITLIGFKLSSMPADKEHPYGHGRLEYVSALLVAFIVILVGLQFTRSSIDRIITPKAVEFSIVPFVILLLSISVKIWLSIFNRKLGELINAKGLIATATDAFGDVLITLVVVLSIVVGQFTTFPIDGIIGLVVSFFIIYAGYNLVKDTISPLIGEAPSEELIQSIYDDISSYEYITGAHDLVVHTYGAGRTMATLDVEFPSDVDVITIHDIIDQAEREIGDRYNLTLVIHMDPLGPESKERYQLRNQVKRIIKPLDMVKSIHDFQILEENGIKIIELHVVIRGDKTEKNKNFDKIKYDLEKKVEDSLDDYKCRIILDVDF